MLTWGEFALEDGNIEEIGFEVITLAFFGDFAQLTHFLIEVDEKTFMVVERHGYNIGVEHLHVFVPQVAVLAFFLQFVGDVFGGIDNVFSSAILDLSDGIAVNVPPLGFLVRASVEQDSDVKALLFTTDKTCVAFMQQFGLFGRHTSEKLLGRHGLCGQYLAMEVAEEISFDVVFDDGVVAHIKGGFHHVVEFCRFADSLVDSQGDETVDEESCEDG